MTAFFQHSGQFYFTLTDLDGRFTYVNPLFSKKFHYLHPDFKGISSNHIIYPGDLTKYLQAIEYSLTEPGKPVAVEVRHPSSNGHLYQSRFEITALCDENNNPVCIQTIGTDISGQQFVPDHEEELFKLSSELKQTNRELSEILQNASEAIFKLDLEGLMVYMTPEFTKLTGYDNNDVYARHWGEFIHPDDLHVCYDAMSKVVLQRLAMRNICYRFRQKNNSYQWYSTSATLVTDETGAPLYVICLSRDITERKYVEDALAASEERYKVFIEQSSEAICRFELEEPLPLDLEEDAIIEHIRNYSFVAECNDIMAEMYGFSVSSELIGKRVHEFMDFAHPRNIDLLLLFIRNGFRISETESQEIDSKGQQRYFSHNMLGIIENGYLRRIWGTQRDITEKRLIESRNRYLASLTENVSDAIIGGDLDLKIVSCNPAGEKLFGFTFDQMIGKRIQDLIEIHYHKTTRDEITQQVFTKGSWSGEASFVRPCDQKLITFLSSISLLKDAEGKAVGVVGINKDITDARAAVERARHLARMVENTTDLLTSADLDFRVVSWNKAAEKVYGLTTAQVTGKNLREFIDISYQDCTRDDVRKQLEKTGEWRGEMYFTRPTDKKAITLLMNFNLQRDDQGVPIGYIIGGTDITERKLAELRIKESEERFRLVADSAPVMVWMCDSENRTNYVNKPWQRFTGLTTRQMLGKGWATVVHPEDVEKATIEFDTHFANRQPMRMIYRLRSGKGDYRWVLDIGIPRMLDDGTFLGYIGSVIDIHDQKLNEDQLRYQANILANVSDSVVITDPEYKVVSWNKVAEELFGIPADEAIGKTMQSLVEFEYINSSYEEVLREFEKNGKWKGETAFVNRRNEKKYLLNTISQISNADGSQVFIMGVGSDISELKKAEQQLQQSELFYRNLIGNSLDGILLTDANGVITFSAPSLKNILGFETHQVMGKSVFGFVHPEDLGLAKDSFYGRESHSITPEYVVLRLLQNTGEWLWCMVRGHNLLENREVRAFVVYLHDDSMRKKAEDELKESERRLRTAQEIAGLGYMELNEAEQLYCSEETTRVLGMTKEETPANLTSLLLMVHANDRKKIRDDIELAFESEATFQHEFRLIKTDQPEKIIQSIGSLIREPASGKATLKITIQDVTNIRAAQLALRTSESRFKSLFEHSIDGILLTQPGGSVKSANPAICEMLGYTSEEILRQKRRDIFDINDPHFNRIVETREESGRFKGELSLVHKSGRKIPCEVSSVLFRDSEGRAYHSTIVRDITRQKEAEQQLKKRESVLSAIAEATNRLILEDNLDSAINYSIKLIGKIVGADRAYIFENHSDVSGRQLASQRYEWCAENILPQAGLPSAENVPFSDFMDVMYPLNENNHFTVFVNQFDNEKLKKRWQSQSIVSILILPIFMRGNLWGFVGFDECHYEREWANWEIDILKAFGSSLAGAIERTKAVQELSQTNAQLGIALNDLNKILDYSQDVICSFDHNGDFLKVSAASARIWGYDPAEVIGRNVREFILEQDIVNTTALIDRMKAGESVATTFENHFKRKDGSLVTLDWSAYWYEKEKIAFCVARDITLQKEIEQQLIASENRFRSFMDNSPAAAWICDEEGRYVYINKLIANQISPEGYNIIGKSMFDLYPKEYANMYHQHNLQALKQNCALEFIEEGVGADGRPNVFLVYKFPVLIGPEQRGIGGVAIDITDKTKAEQALRTSEQNLKAIFSSTRDAFVLLDKNLKLVSFNPIAAELYSMFTEGDHIEECPDLLMILPPERQEVLMKNLALAFNGQSLEYEVQYNIGNASYWFNCVIRPVVGPEAQVDAICVTISNVTPRKRQEMTLALEKRVLELNALPESSLADSVNTLLQGIEKIYPGMLCSVVQMQNDVIRPLAAPSIPEEYSAAIDGLMIGEKVGSCGTAMYLKKPVFVSDIENDPLWKDFKSLALQHKLRACWSIPIINARNEVLASFAIYYQVPKEPLDYEIRAIERAADILRVIIQNKQAEDHIRVSNQRYHFVTKATNEAIWDLDLSTNNIYWADGYFTLFGYDQDSGDGSLEQSHQRIHPHDLPRIKTSLQNFLRKKTKTRWEDEYRYRKSDGTYSHVVDKAFLIIDKEGKPVRMIGSMQDITSRKVLEQRLIEQEIGKQRLLTQATIDGQEKERREIGKELHDNINQILSTTKLYLDLAHNNTEGSTAEMIAISSRNIMEAINEIRKLSRSLVPPTLGDLGLIESVKDLCETFTSMQTFNIEFVHRNIREKQLPENQKLMLFRIIQEQTNNIVKHAKAKNVKIEMKAIRSLLTLQITDDGSGFDLSKTKKGVGLNNIINRAELFNGKVEIAARPGNGCSVKVSIPVKY
ncbi:MAG TPA: PAS domain S-box protein [Chitinophagaceae bacterium]